MNNDIEKILEEGRYNFKHGLEKEHQILERVIQRVVNIKDISEEDVSTCIDDLRQWHIAGLRTDPIQESPPPEGLLLRTSLLENSHEWVDILKQNRLSIEQTVLDPNFASVVEVARKFEKSYDHDLVVDLFETCVEYYANRGPDTADLGMKKAIYLWNGLEDQGDLDELLDRQKQNLRQLMGLCVGKIPTHTLTSYVRKTQLEEIAGPRIQGSKKPSL